MSVEINGILVFGIDDHGKDRDFRAGGAHQGIPDQAATHPPPLKILVYGQPSESGNWYGRITRQSLCHRLWNIGQGNIRCGKRVEPRNTIGLILKSHVACRDAAAHILRHTFDKIAVKCPIAAEKSMSVVLGRKNLDPERRAH